MKKLKHMQLFEEFNPYKSEIKTIRELVDINPIMWDYHYKWRNTEEPELEKSLDEVINDLGFKFKGLSSEDVDDLITSYNDIKGYLNVEIEPISQH